MLFTFRLFIGWRGDSCSQTNVGKELLRNFSFWALGPWTIPTLHQNGVCVNASKLTVSQYLYRTDKATNTRTVGTCSLTFAKTEQLTTGIPSQTARLSDRRTGMCRSNRMVKSSKKKAKWQKIEHWTKSWAKRRRANRAMKNITW